MEAPNNNAGESRNRDAVTRRFTHPLDHARSTRAVARDANILDDGRGQGRLTARKNPLRGFKRIRRPGGLLPVSGYSLRPDAQTMNGNPARILRMWPTKKKE